MPYITTRQGSGEIHAAIARAHRLKKFSSEDLTRIRQASLNDWLFGLSAIEVNAHTMSELPRLVENHPLRVSDAIHLSAAFWLMDTVRLRGHRPLRKEEFEFGVADLRLAEAAAECGLAVFNPEQFD